MQTFENLLLQNYSSKFLDITYKNTLGMFKIKVCSNNGATYIIGDINSQRQFEHRKFDANL